MEPKISIVTAVFNRADTIEQALKSVYCQQWPSIEHVVIDGASTDGTREYLELQRGRVAALVSEADGGIYDALNKGFALSTGDVIGLLHSDDFFADCHVLERVAQVFADPSVDGCYGDLDYVSKDDPSRIVRHWRAGDFDERRLVWGWMAPHPTVFLRRSVIERWGGYDTDLRIAADYDAMLRYFAVGRIKLEYIPEVLVKMRVGGESNNSLSHILRKSREDYVALRKNKVGGLGALFWKNFSKLPQFIR